eukprot:1828161-Amphidinium_carterae.1
MASGEWDKDPQEEEVEAAVKVDEEANQRYEARTGSLLVQACLVFGSICVAFLGVLTRVSAAAVVYGFWHGLLRLFMWLFVVPSRHFLLHVRALSVLELPA